MVELNELFKKEETKYLKELHSVLGRTSGVGDAGYVVYNAIGAVLDDRRRNPPKPKGFKVTMGCGEEHFIETTQPEIATVEINGKQIYPSENISDRKDHETYHEFAKMFSRITGENWKFTGWGGMAYWDNEGKDNGKNDHLSDRFAIPWAGIRGKGYSRFKRIL